MIEVSMEKGFFTASAKGIKIIARSIFFGRSVTEEAFSF